MSVNESAESAADKRLVRVTILQQPYTLRSSGEPGETEALAHYVDDLMNQIAARGGGSETSRVAVLAALHLADRLRNLEKAVASRESVLAGLESRLAAVIEE
jgi:cell division protein ZapA